MHFMELFLLIMGFYLIFSLFLVYLVHRIPREPVEDAPDWGHVVDTRIQASDGGYLEVWRVEPEGPSKGIVVLAHGWSRNRDRMTGRARIFGEMGFTTVLFSARDHGRSSKFRFMNAYRFAQDIESVLEWVNEPVLLYGHSAGAAGAVIAAAVNKDKIQALFLEGCYARTKEALRSLYRAYNLFFGIVFAPAVVFMMDIFYRLRLDKVSPARLAPGLDLPVLIIHGEKDEGFPVEYARVLSQSFPEGRAELFIGKGADHSGSHLVPGYTAAIRSFLDRHFPVQ